MLTGMNEPVRTVRSPVLHWSRGANRSSRIGRSSRHQAGLTLLELLISVAIFGTALLSLGYYHTGAMIGARQDRQITEANQVAVTVAEDWRDNIRKDASSDRLYDAGVSGDRTVTIGGVAYSVHYDVIPQRLNPSGEFINVPHNAEPHVFRLEITVTAPSDYSRDYTTLVFRTPSK